MNGQRVKQGLVIAFVVAALAGCAESRDYDGPEGLAPDRRVVELSDAEWETFCEWQEELYLSRYGESRYMCDGEAVTYNVTASACIANARTGLPDDCAITVGSYAECQKVRAEVRCWASMVLPECQLGGCPPSRE